MQYQCIVMINVYFYSLQPHLPREHLLKEDVQAILLSCEGSCKRLAGQSEDPGSLPRLVGVGVSDESV